jgi:hypothetical protein
MYNRLLGYTTYRNMFLGIGTYFSTGTTGTRSYRSFRNRNGPARPSAKLDLLPPGGRVRGGLRRESAVTLMAPQGLLTKGQRVNALSAEGAAEAAAAAAGRGRQEKAFPLR